MMKKMKERESWERDKEKQKKRNRRKRAENAKKRMKNKDIHRLTNSIQYFPYDVIDSKVHNDLWCRPSVK